jgi:hypothetical protein
MAFTALAKGRAAVRRELGEEDMLRTGRAKIEAGALRERVCKRLG